jgi:ubiquinone/menaquinone biosynthesis C-methylase UbiE
MLPVHECDIEKMLSERETVMVRDYDAALDLAGFDARETIMDVATGSGRMLLQLLRRGHSVISSDIDPDALCRARERLADLADKPTLIVMDAHNIQFPDDSFAAVTLVNAVHEIDDPGGVLAEITRVLTVGGKLLVVEFNSQGFELMELHHRMQGKGEHPKGEMSTDEIDRYLRSLFDRVETRELSITHAWVASGKRRRTSR